jgi:uncharacterized protein
LSPSGRTVYIDSSALVKLVVPEPETTALRTELAAWERYVSSALVQTEVVRACARVSVAARRIAERLVTTLDLVAVDDEILNAAARLKPLELRTPDAIHVASAQALGATLGVVIAYDERLVQAARTAKLATTEPR